MPSARASSAGLPTAEAAPQPPVSKPAARETPPQMPGPPGAAESRPAGRAASSDEAAPPGRGLAGPVVRVVVSGASPPRGSKAHGTLPVGEPVAAREPNEPGAVAGQALTSPAPPRSAATPPTPRGEAASAAGASGNTTLVEAPAARADNATGSKDASHTLTKQPDPVVPTALPERTPPSREPRLSAEAGQPSGCAGPHGAPEVAAGQPLHLAERPADQPAAAGDAPAEPGMSSGEQMLDQVTAAVRCAAQRRSEAAQAEPVSRVAVQLRPPELGVVRIAVEACEGQLRAHLQASHPAVQAWLEAQAPALRAHLADAGVALHDMSLGHWAGHGQQGRTPDTSQPLPSERGEPLRARSAHSTDSWSPDDRLVDYVA